MKSELIVAIICAALSCVSTRAYYLNKLQGYKNEVNAASLTVQEKHRLAEQELQSQVTSLLEESYDRQMEIYRLTSANTQLVFELGGLRDPGAASGCASGNENKNTGSDTKTTAGQLSREATEFLLNLTREADETREQLRLCQEFVRKLPECVE